jgi:hypothetical protein
MKCINTVRSQQKVRGNRLKVNYPCRKCLPCMITRRQEWTARLLLEMQVTLNTYYVTLTYDDDHLPPLASLRRKDLRDFLKRLRKNTKSKLRYFAAGEYGDKKGRPHYHILLFSNDELQVDIGYCKERRKVCSISGDFHKAWSLNGDSFGLVDVVPGLNRDDGKRVAAYVAGYVLKKIGQEKCLPGKEPEFQVMSKKPGLGVIYVDALARSLKNQGAGPLHYDGTSVTYDLQMVRIDGKLYPLARTLRDKIKEKYDGPPSELTKALRQNIQAWKDDIVKDTGEYEYQENENRAKARNIFRKYLRSRLD